MSYTVHEVARRSGVTIKTLYHYQKIGLLAPEYIAENGYRYYGGKELERLQQILFYRELDFPLEKIKLALQNEPSRLQCLCEQRSLLWSRQQRLSRMMRTINETINCVKKGVQMSTEKLFAGLNRQEWENALQPQNEHLQEKYGYAVDTSAIDIEAMNEKANEAMEFMSFMADALRNGVKADDQCIRAAIEKHIAFMAKDMDIDARSFAAQSRFLMNDDYHRKMIESLQAGLSYYICFAAESYAT